MNFHTNELILDLPEIISDRSVNVLTVAAPQGGVPFQIIINRDLLLNGESLQQCFDRQVAQMTRQTKVLKVVSKRSVQIGQEQLDGLEIESSFNQAGKNHHQIQAMWVTQAPNLLVLTLSSPVAIRDSHRAVWQQALNSLISRPADTGSSTTANPVKPS